MRARFIPFALIAALTLGACDSGGSDGDPSSPGPTAPTVTSPTTGPTTGPATTPVTGSVSITHTGPPHPGKPTVPADVPTTGPNLLKKGEKPPVMPLEATQHTRDGAIAFGKFFIQTIDWGFATMSGSYMKHYFRRSCEACLSFRSGMDRAKGLGHRYIGGRFAVRAAEISSGATSAADFAVEVTFDETSFEELDAKGRFYQADIAHRGEQFSVSMVWRSAAWTVTDLTLQR